MKFVEFPTADGLTLPGLLFEGGGQKVAINIHGNGSSSVFYDVKDSMDLPDALNKKGISLLKFNNRGAHIIKKLNVKKGNATERLKFGCAYEVISECVYDINAAVEFLKKLGYKEFYLIGNSTGANKICVYNHYEPQNTFKKFVMTSGGDDTGIYYNNLGQEIFSALLAESKKQIDEGSGDLLIQKLLPDEIFSYKGFYDLANPDGDYNCFPFLEKITGTKLSSKPLFRHFKSIETPTLVVYGENDEYAWGKVSKIVDILKELQPGFVYETVKNADHGFTGKKSELAKIISGWLSK